MQDNVANFDAATPVQATLLAGGRSNVSYKLTDANNSSWVLRRPPLGHIMPSAHDMGREFRVLSGLNSVSFPTPTTRGYCEDESVIGAKFMLMDFVDGRVIESAKSATEQGVKVYTIGMGSEQGTPIPIYNNGAKVGYLQDHSGQTIMTKLNSVMLEDIAEAGKGKFIHATNSDDGLSIILKELNALDEITVPVTTG
jgi:hypothetical protein